MTLKIIPVSTDAELERFIRVPMRLNAADPKYIAPLLFERREALSPKHNPFFEHAEAQFWLAVRGGKDVGRISAQIDSLCREAPGVPTGQFGMIAAEDDPEVFKALFETAEAWLKARGKIKVMGPFNLSINEETGLLVAGHDTPPFIMMAHDQPYVAARVEELGYAKAKDLIAWFTDIPTFPKAVEKRLARPLGDGVVFRPVDMKHFERDIKALVEIYNDAWAENWESVPITESETKYMKDSLGFLLKPGLIWFMEIDGEPAAFGVMTPDLNWAARDLGGKLFPFGWAKLLWRLKVGKIPRFRVPLMGVKRKFAKDPRGILAPFRIIRELRDQSVKYGMTNTECGWVLEDNRPMNHIMENLQARPYKTYRVYEKMVG
ncbi:MAG TPA: dATP pyrophosphohydrolase [Caulobacteraceae bacterium]